MNPAFQLKSLPYTMKGGVKPLVIKPAPCLKGNVYLLGDKSIAHRAIILSSLSQGLTAVKNFPLNKDCISTIEAFRKLGVNISRKPSLTFKKTSGIIIVSGKGLLGLKKPAGDIFVGESGTTARLLLGILAGQDFQSTLKAAKSLSGRPMLRVTGPLRKMGAQIKSRKIKAEEYLPITIGGGNLKAISYRMPVASAQVKSAILLAALYAKGKTKVLEPVKTRDHTERMLKLFRADIKANRNTITINAGKELISPKEIYIPGDISSAAFFMVLAVINPDSRIRIKNVNLNPTRSGIINVLRRMGANIQISVLRSQFCAAEPAGDILVKSSELKGVVVKMKEIPSLVDELPILMVAACYARGKTVLEGVGELRVKETDRIESMLVNLKAMGADINVERANGYENVVVKGIKRLNAAKVRSFGDHRTAMSMVVAGLSASGNTSLNDISCIDKSFPDFLGVLNNLRGSLLRGRGSVCLKK